MRGLYRRTKETKDMKTTLHKTTRGTGIIMFLLMTLFASPISAQGAAEVWLNKAIGRLRDKGVEIVFRINEEGMRTSGKLLINEQKFAYDTEEMKIWYDGTTQWTLQQGGGYNELYISNPTIEDQQSINPYLLLNNYKKSFTIADGGEKSHNGKMTHLVILSAGDGSKDFKGVNVYIYSDGTLAALELEATNGYIYEIEIRSMRNGLTFPKETFTYSKKEYPADEVIDMR